MDRNNRFEFTVNLFQYGNTAKTPLFKKYVPNREVSVSTVSRERLHRWLDEMIDDENVANIHIYKYNIEKGYIPEKQQELIEREKVLDELEEIYKQVIQ